MRVFQDLNHFPWFIYNLKIHYVVTVQYMSSQIADSQISLPVENSPMQMINCENLCAAL